MKHLLSLLIALPLVADDAEPVLLRYKAEPGTVLRYRVRIVNRQEARAGERRQTIEFERTGRRTLVVFDRSADPPRFTFSSEDDMNDARLLSYEEDGKDRLEAARADIQPTLPRAAKQLAFFTLDDQGREMEDLSSLPLDAALLRSLSDIQILPDAPVAVRETWTRELRAGPLLCKYEYALASDGARPKIVSRFTVETLQPPAGTSLSFAPGEVAMEFDADLGILVSLRGKTGVTATATDKEDALSVALEIELDGLERLRSEVLASVAEEGGILATVYRAYETGILDRAALGLEEFLERYPDSRWRAGAKGLLDGLRATFPLLLSEAPAPVIQEWIGGQPEIAGQVVLLAFWTTWEENCRASTPALTRWSETFGPSGLVVAGVTMIDDRQDRSAVEEFVSRQALPFPMGIDDGEKTFSAFHVVTIPHLFLLDKRGRVRWQGHPAQASVVEYMIRSLLAE